MASGKIPSRSLEVLNALGEWELCDQNKGHPWIARRLVSLLFQIRDRSKFTEIKDPSPVFRWTLALPSVRA